ncbi:MAG: four helix bundle protein [Balneola sp.]
MKQNLILSKTFDFSLLIIYLFKELQDEREYVVSKQVLRSSTSIGANAEEAIAAQSRKDFIHKMSISLKEARETYYWLRLLDKSELTSIDISNHLVKSDEIISILSAIVKTTKSRNKNS